MPKSLAIGLVIGASLSGGVGNAFRSVEQKSAHLRQTLKKQRIGKDLASDVIKYKNTLQELRAKQATLGHSSDRLERGISEVERRYKAAKRAAKAYGIDIGRVTREHAKFSTQVRRSEQALVRLQQRQRNQAARRELRGQVIGALAPAYAMGRVFQSAMNFETAGVRLGTVINARDQEAAVAKAKEHAAAFSRKNLAKKTEVLDVNYALSSAGLEAEAARLGSEIVLKVAKVTGGMPERVGEVVATTFQNLQHQLKGTDQEKLARVGELLTKTQFKFQIRDFGQLGESMKYAFDPITRFNIALEQGVTLIGQLNSAGLQGGMAGTAFAAAMRNMSKAADEFGFMMIENEKGQLDVIATLEDMRDVLGDVDEWSQKTKDAMGKAFGEEGARAISPLIRNLDKLKKDQADVVEGSRGLVDESYQKFLESTPGQWALLGNNIIDVGDAFASSLLPSVNGILRPLIKTAGWVGALVEKYPVLGRVMGGVVVGMIGFKVVTLGTKFALLSLKDGLGMAKGAFQFFFPTVARAEGSLVRFNAVTLITAGRTRALAVGGALKSLGGTLLTLGRSVIPTVITAMRGLNLAFMASPIGLILTGIAVGAALIIANWSKIKSALAPILEWLGEKLAWIGEVAKGIGKAVGWVAGKLGLGKEKVPKIGETAGAATEPSQALPYTEPSMVEYSGSAEAGEVSVVINQTVNLDSGTPPDALRRALTEGRERIREVVEEIMESYMVRRRRLGSA